MNDTFQCDYCAKPKPVEQAYGSSDGIFCDAVCYQKHQREQV